MNSVIRGVENDDVLILNMRRYLKYHRKKIMLNLSATNTGKNLPGLKTKKPTCAIFGP